MKLKTFLARAGKYVSLKIVIWSLVILLYRILSVHLIPQISAVMILTGCNRNLMQCRCLCDGILLPTVFVSHYYMLQINVISPNLWAVCRIDEWCKTSPTKISFAQLLDVNCQIFCVVKSN